MSIKKAPIHRVVAPTLLTIMLSACGSSSDSVVDDLLDEGIEEAIATCDEANAAEVDSVDVAPIFAFASTAASDFSAGQYERISISETPVLSGCTTPGLSDVFVVTDGEFAYGLGRSSQDSLTQFDIESLEANSQFSLIGADATTANPHDVVFVNDTRAYVARYDTGMVWIINPSATTDAEFFLGTIDLSVYDDDGATQMTAMDLIGDNLYVLMQRLDIFTPSDASYLAVFDVSGAVGEEVEIATGMGADGLDGIELPVTNVQEMFFNEATNDLIITAAGDFFGSTGGTPLERLQGGIIAVDATDFTLEVLVDDNVLNPEPADGEELVPEFFDTATIVSADKGYIVSGAEFGVSFLRSFNPTTGIVNPETLADFDGVNITTLQVSPSGNVWVGINDEINPGFDVLNPDDDSLVGERILTELNPNTVVFISR